MGGLAGNAVPFRRPGPGLVHETGNERPLLRKALVLKQDGSVTKLGGPDASGPLACQRRRCLAISREFAQKRSEPHLLEVNVVR